MTASTLDTRSLLAALLVNSRESAQEKTANLGRIWQLLFNSAQKAMARPVSGGIRFTGTRLPTLARGQTYSALSRAGRIQSPVSVIAGDPAGRQLLVRVAGQAKPVPLPDFLRSYAGARRGARSLMRQGQPALPEQIKIIGQAGHLAENPAAYAALPAAIRKAVGAKVRGAVSPQFRYGARVAGTPRTPPPLPAPTLPPPLPAPQIPAVPR